MMTDSRDILRSAHMLIEHHGDNAGAEAARHAEKWRAKGNQAGHELWSAIVRAIDVLRAADIRSGPAPELTKRRA
jgi:hypothetical protein